jgi:hypothetical protein
MSTDITSALVPRREDGELDQRFLSIVSEVIAEQSKEAIYYLTEAKEASKEHQRKYYPYVRDVVLSILAKASKVNLDGCYRKHIREVVQEFGYTPSNTSFIVGALTLVHESILAKSNDAEWLKELPVRTAYALSKCSNEGRSKAWIDSKWGAESFTVAQAEALARRYPKPALFGRGTGSGRRAQDTKPSEHLTSSTPFVVSDRNKAEVDALSSASAVTTQTYTAPIAAVEESVDIEAVAVSVIDTTSEAPTAITDLLAEQVVANKFDQIILQLRDAMAAFNTAPIEQKRHCYKQIENIASIVDRALSNR